MYGTPGKTNAAPVLFSMALAVLAYGAPNSPADASEALRIAIDSPLRTPRNVARDAHRHPYETLMFFGIEPGMTVAEIDPGIGTWYMEILAPFLAQGGVYYAVGDDPQAGMDAYDRQNYEAFIKNVSDRPALFSGARITAFAPLRKDIAPPGSVDMVLTFRSLHNWLEDGIAEAAFSAFFRSLKPGGILGVVQHRANDERPQEPRAPNGYVHERHVIDLAESAGFRLVARSEINANPQDTKGYPGGVWELPPTLAVSQTERPARIAIGESDRMTLKFTKPLQGTSDGIIR